MLTQRGSVPACTGTDDGTVVVTGMGRSGTRFLSTLLSRAENAVARHEFIGDTTFASLSYYNPGHPLVAAKLRRGLDRFRSEAPGADRHVAVEPGLRYAVPVVQSVSPHAQCFHLVRNGRAVVQSMQRRKYLTGRDPHLPCMPFDAAEFEHWERSDRFDRLCWYWADSVRRLLQLGLKTLYLERVVDDYDYLDAELLRPSGIALSRPEWIRQRERRVNRSGWRLRIKAWIGRRPGSEPWDDDRERRFRAVCGDMMDTLSYS